MTATGNIIDRLQSLIGKAEALGADAADAVFVRSASLSLSQRLGNPEDLMRSEDNDLGLRVFVGKRQAVVSSSDMSDSALDELAERAVAMARNVPEDAFCGLADPDQLATELADIDDFDPSEPTAEDLIALAARTEDAARAVPGVTNSEGASASWSSSEIALVTSTGFAQTRQASRHSIGVSVLAGTGTAMERDYDYDTKVYAADLADAEAIGRSAGEKTVRRLNPRKVSTQQAPVIFDPRVANTIPGHMSSAINGSSVARGTTFLKDAMGTQIFADGVTIVDDPHRRRGLRSKPFDGEGVATRRLNVVEDGRLTTWILDCRSARQLKLATTGHASRGTSSPPSPSASNLYMEAGTISPKDLIGGIKQGLYVTELIGMGVNGVTGDYSRGCSGFWIEDGELTFPVSELTIAGNLKDMFKAVTPADDLEFKYGTNAPTLRIDGMTVAGK
ncbi:metallopeptidase TldD-related protein [Thalassospiraceae bacterium LMO-SO8]|nr:metallopeptidase TldD-related protein [Alphaproteobacteria bacterium LMO-S08]WND77931.1 metallopeptidase TldD-related protein [Thalassospiraceae bacterium LMO-SO8]